MRYLMLLGIILYFSFCLTVIFNIKPGRSLPASFIIVFFSAYIPLLLERLSLFKLTFLILSVVFNLLTIYKRKNDLKSLITNVKQFFNVSVIVYIVLYLYFCLVLSNVKLSNTDDLGFWGTFVKDILRNGTLARRTADQYFLYSYRTYVPFAYVLNTAIQLIVKGYYHEPTLLFGFSMLTLSFFMFLFDKFKYDKKFLPRIIISLLMVLLLTLVVQNNELFMSKAFVFNSIYVDWILGIALGLGLYEIINFDYDSNNSYFSLGIYLVIELTVKSVGQCLFLLLVFTFIVISIIKKKISKKLIKNLLLIMIVPIVIYLSYHRYYQWVEGTPMLDNIQDSTLVNTIIESNAEENTISNKSNLLSITKVFLTKMMFMPLYRHPIGISYFSINTIIFICFIVTNNIKRERNYLIPIFTYLGSFAYALGIFLSYLIIFNHEGTTLAMFGRYMQTYTYANLIFVFLYLSDKLNRNGLIALLVVAALFVEPNSLKTVVYNKDLVNYKEKEIYYFENYLNNDYSGENMVIINQTMVEYAQLIRNVSEEKNQYFTYVMCDDALISVDEFKKLISKNDLIFIGDFDDRFNKYWSSVTDEPCYNTTLYSIVHNDDGTDAIKLLYCWEWEISIND